MMLVLLGSVAWVFIACSPPPSIVSPAHIILFIGDGMQLEHEVAASRYLYGTDFGLSWHGFTEQLYVTSWDVTTYNAYAADQGKPVYDETTFDPVVGYSPDPAAGGSTPFPLYSGGSSSYFLRAATDSASSATAYATGTKTDSGNIAWQRGDPAGGQLESIAERMKDLGAAIGMVTTVPFNHATPAAFASHNVSRSNYQAIADEMIATTRPDVVVGGGHPGWCATYFSLAGLSTLQSNAGYTLVEKVDGQNGGAALLDAALNLPQGKKLFGFFGGADGDFNPPVPRDAPGSPGFDVVEENPSLEEMVEAALTVLSRNPNGFFLMAEEGDIDHANHANDYARMIGTMWGLEQAVKAAEAFVDRPGDDLDWGNTLLIVTADHANSLMRLTGSPVLGKGDLPAQVGGAPWTYPGGELTYGTTGHTNELVTLYARGAHASLFEGYTGRRYPGARIIDNTEVFAVMLEAASTP
jgi:alkaline phosphatase